MANVLGGEPTAASRSTSGCTTSSPATRAPSVHLYGKQVRPGRKIGHVTVLGDDMTAVRARAAARPPAWLQEGTVVAPRRSA